jgi:arginase family enzyme
VVADMTAGSGPRWVPGDAIVYMRLAGADVVEVSPAYDHAEMTAVAAAHVYFELLALMLLGQQ